MTSPEPHRKYEILQTCSELLATLTPADQKMILAALIEQCGQPQQGRPVAARRPSGSGSRPGKWWKG